MRVFDALRDLYAPQYLVNVLKVIPARRLKTVIFPVPAKGSGKASVFKAHIWLSFHNHIGARRLLFVHRKHIPGIYALQRTPISYYENNIYYVTSSPGPSLGMGPEPRCVYVSKGYRNIYTRYAFIPRFPDTISQPLWYFAGLNANRLFAAFP
jgi:hypothetical protein